MEPGDKQKSVRQSNVNDCDTDYLAKKVEKIILSQVETVVLRQWEV